MDKDKLPKISVIIPVLNGEKSIEKAIGSILEQKYENLELIILDAGSTDGTLDIIKRYAPSIHYWHSKPDGSAYQAINWGIEHSTGDLIAQLMADDWFEANTFHVIAQALLESPATDIISCGGWIVGHDEVLKQYHPLKIYTSTQQVALNFQNICFGLPVMSTRFLTRSLIKKIGLIKPFDAEGKHIFSADREFLLRAVAANCKSETVSHLGHAYLAHATSATFGGNRVTELRIYQEHIAIAEDYLKKQGLSQQQRAVMKNWYHDQSARFLLRNLQLRDFKSAWGTAKSGISQGKLDWLISLFFITCKKIAKKYAAQNMQFFCLKIGSNAKRWMRIFRKKAPVERVFIVDPCVGNMTGHWESYCRRFFNELVARDLPVKVYCQANPNPAIVKGLNVSPVFTCNPFSNISDMYSFKNESEAFRKELAKINWRDFKKGDLLIFPTIFPQFLKPIMEWLEPIISPEGPRVAILFMLAAGQGDPNNQLENKKSPMLAALFGIKPFHPWKYSYDIGYYKAFSGIFKNKNYSAGYHYFGVCDDFSFNFSQMLGVAVHSLPIPTVVTHSDKSYSPGEDKEKEERLRVGYFGHSSLEKGTQFLEHVVRKTLSIYPSVKFDLHINPNIHTQEILKVFDIPQCGITCYYGHLDYQDLIKLMRSVGINLISYDPVKYATMPSSIFTEAICAGNVVVIPNHTWMAHEAAKIKTGYVLFDRYDQHAIAESLHVAIANYLQLKSKVPKAQARFLRKNNIKSYMDILLCTVQW